MTGGSGSPSVPQPGLWGALLPAPQQREPGQEGSRRCRHRWEAMGQEAAGQEEGRRKEEEEFCAFVNHPGSSRREGKK